MGSVIGSFTNPAGNIASATINSDAQRDTNLMNYKIHQEDNAFNASEAEKARMFNSQEADINRRFNSSEAYLQFLRTQQLNQEQMKFNAGEADKTRAFEEEMYNKYESPLAKAASLERAGLNPAALLGAAQGTINGAPTASISGGSVGSASGSAASGSAASASHAPQMVAPHIDNPLAGLVEGLVSLQNLSVDKRLKSSQVAYQDLQNEYFGMRQVNEMMKNRADAYKSLKDGDLSGEQRKEVETKIKLLDNQLDLYENTKQYQFAQSETEAAIAKVKLCELNVDYSMKAFDLKVQPLRFEMEQKLGKAQADSLIMQARASLMNAFSAKYDAKTHRMQVGINWNQFKLSEGEFYQQVKESSARIRKLNAETSKTNEETLGVGIQNELRSNELEKSNIELNSYPEQVALKLMKLVKESAASSPAQFGAQAGMLIHFKDK